MSDYRDRFMANLAKQCRARGIPEPEVASVLAELKAKFPRFDALEDHELKRVAQALPAFLTDYLDGEKRRPVLRGTASTKGAGAAIR